MPGISDLLRYKQKVELRSGDEIIGEVWIRVLGDYDLQQAYQQSRIASARKRAALRTVGSNDYMDFVETYPDSNTVDEAKNVIKAAKLPTMISETYAQLDRDDPAKMEEVAAEPDAPTLEEQETLDAIEVTQEKSYEERVRENIGTKMDVLAQELDAKTDVEIYDMAKYELSNLLSTSEFQIALENQKIFRATYLDEKCRTKAFLDIEDYMNAHESVKRQLVAAYEALEISGPDIKK